MRIYRFPVFLAVLYELYLATNSVCLSELCPKPYKVSKEDNILVTPGGWFRPRAAGSSVGGVVKTQKALLHLKMKKRVWGLSQCVVGVEAPCVTKLSCYLLLFTRTPAWRFFMCFWEDGKSNIQPSHMHPCMSSIFALKDLSFTFTHLICMLFLMSCIRKHTYICFLIAALSQCS
jgi:hypothetical protein